MIADVSIVNLTCCVLASIVFNLPVFVGIYFRRDIRGQPIRYTIWLSVTAMVWVISGLTQAALCRAGLGTEHYKEVHRNIFTFFALLEFAMGGVIVIVMTVFRWPKSI
jgi:hypothetical protein